ncbi:MAG: YIP1 family protein [Tannerella sp.]|jgi:fumarate reductase subunit D|nr:YIP1 family protein [Tannerella sp.]
MFKELYYTTISLIFSPSKAWRDLCEKRTDNNEKFLSDFVYPFVGVITLAAFLGVLFARKEFDIQIALKSAILSLLSVFGGFFLASYLVNEMWHSLFRREKNMKLCQNFVGYSSVLMFSLDIILSLLPVFFFLRFLVLYTIYIVWEGAIPYMDVQEPEQLKFVGFSTIIIIGTPYIIGFILRLLMPGLRY